MQEQARGPSKLHRAGTHRSRSPADTLAWVAPLAKQFGITRIANLTGLDRTGIPVVMVCRPNARSSAVFHGKGLDMDCARASGVMEAIETWHAEHVRLPLRFESVSQLGERGRTADVDKLPRLPDRQLDMEAPLLWAQGRNLIDGEALWAPFELVNAHSTRDGPPGSGCFNGSTNGLASGNHRLEATSHALCELIERDATALWRQSEVSEQDRRRLDLASVDDPDCLDVLARFTRADIDLAVWDVTTDVGVPAFQCYAIDQTGEIGHLGVGAGCHPSRDVALLRALTEAAQVRTTYIAGSREDILHSDYHPARLAARSAEMRALLRRAGERRDFKTLPGFEFETFESEVDWLVDRLRLSGVDQVISFDLTRPEYEIPVIRIVASGLEGFDHNPAAHAPGPRALGVRRRR